MVLIPRQVRMRRERNTLVGTPTLIAPEAIRLLGDEHSPNSATRTGWSEGNESCDEFMKFGMSSSGCETGPPKG